MPAPAQDRHYNFHIYLTSYTADVLLNVKLTLNCAHLKLAIQEQNISLEGGLMYAPILCSSAGHLI